MEHMRGSWGNAGKALLPVIAGVVAVAVAPDQGPQCSPAYYKACEAGDEIRKMLEATS